MSLQPPARIVTTLSTGALRTSSTIDPRACSGCSTTADWRPPPSQKPPGSGKLRSSMKKAVAWP
jgi:hypothetical protein